MVIDSYDNGYRVLVEGKYNGMIYHTDVIEKLNVGQTIEAYIRQIREDAKIDISLKPYGHAAVPGDQAIILAIMKESGGFIPYDSKTDSDTIKKVFKMSKKSFKKAVGGLYKSRKVRVTKNGIKLLK